MKSVNGWGMVLLLLASLLTGCGGVTSNIISPLRYGEMLYAARFPDVAYGRHTAQKLDVYALPEVDNAPVIFAVHGGSGRAGAAFIARKVNHWVAKGFVVISVDYRPLPQADALAQTGDIARALAFAQQRAAEWGGDPDRFVLLGFSGGGHLVALLSANPAIVNKRNTRPWLGSVVLDSAAIDTVGLMSATHNSVYDEAFGADPRIWRVLSPLDRLTRDALPMYLVCSTQSREDSCPAAERFVDRAQALDVRAELNKLALSPRQINAELGLENRYTEQVDGFLSSLGEGIQAMLAQ